ISLQKFQQKVLKQTKQKKSKSAEFLMVKEAREATEGTGNPAFNMSSPDLSAHQTSEKKVIRHDMLDRTLAAHQQKFRLLASAEPKGNEYSRNYFDPLTDEEINPRQYGMEVSGEGELELSTQLLHRCFKCILNIFFSSLFSFMQDSKFEGEGLSEYLPMSCLKTDKTFEKYVPFMFLHHSRISRNLSFLCVEQSRSPQPLQIQMKCIRGLKNKAPQGSYFLKVSLLGRPGGRVLPWCLMEQLKTRTHPLRHDGNFYDVGLYFHESLYVVLPSKKDVKPGAAFLFELILLRGKSACLHQVVGWTTFPLYDSNLDVVEGKFKCPLLRGHYDQKLDNFRKIEDLICLDLDHWLCNLYFQVVKLPLHLDDQNNHERRIQLPPEFPVCLVAEAEKAESGVDNTAGLSEKETEKNICASRGDEAKSSSLPSQGSVSNKIGPCPTDCGLNLSKEDHELHNKETSTAWKTGETEDYSQDTSYLEELEKHRFSVCCSSVADSTGSGEFFKHLYFVLASVFSELQFAQWQSQGFWYIILLTASLWFLRLYLHYLSQWLFLQAISIPVTKFHFSPLTVELCYPTSLLRIGEELLVVVMGPLMLNAMVLPLVLIRWGCQVLFAFCPDVLSKLIITMGLWTVLDPLAVFIVDTVLGRLSHDGETPVADAAKLYWMFEKTMQSGILGVVLTVLLYVLLFIISSLILYLYCLRLHNDSWILDAFQRIHSEETKFFIPYDLEISNQELSYIVKRSEQWRGLNGERRKVAVYDYIWKSHGVQSGISSCDLQQQNETSVSALGPGDVTSHIAVYTVYPSGFQELYRHFLRLPSGAIVEVFGDISGLKFIPGEVVMAIQEHLSEMDSTLEDSLDIKSRGLKRIH
uniref:Orofacial cleft 1 candidate gene 1 protein n=1 Tax=Balaenoptera musculus TaxID=9771 RepID=A0A8C0CUJ4_BALMU